MSRIVLLITAFVLTWLTANLPAAPPVPRNPEWVALDGGTMHLEQGWAVDISGDRAIVGAPARASGGSAFIFDVNTGQLIHRLDPRVPQGNDSFGFSVAIDDDLAIVGSGQNNAAYIFDVNTGQQLHELRPVNDIRYGIHYVRSVDISDGLAVLGVPTLPPTPFETFPRDIGAAFVYDARAGNLLYRLNGPTGSGQRQFGLTVATEGNTLAVSSPSVFDESNVHVYDAATGRLQWTYGYETTGEDLEVRDIAIDDDLIVIGAGQSVFDMPEALVLDRSSGDLLKRIDTQIENENDDYKYQLDVSGDRLVVGSWGTFYEDHGYFVGDTHAFDINSGGYLGSVANPRPSAGDDFGFSVAFEGNRLIVGAPSENSNFGMAYSFLLIPEPSTPSFLLVMVMSGLRLRPRRGRA